MRFAIICFTILCSFLSSFGQNNTTLNLSIEKVIKKYSVTGLSICLILDNEIIYNNAFGYSNLSPKKAVNVETFFRIASISKTITGTAVMQLYEEGKLSLDEDISKYLSYKVRNPNYPDDIITIRMLANHVSSLNDGIGYDGFLDATYSAVIPDVRELLLPDGGFYTKDMWMKYKPGAGYIYCNSGYGLLGTIVEKISGERFDQYCIKHIFNPLKMKSRFNVDDIDINNLAVLYRDTVPQYDNYGTKKVPRDLSKYVIGTNAAAFSPQGGLRTSAIDLAKFLLAHINKGSYNGTKILNDTTALILEGKIFPLKGLGNPDKNRGVSIHYTQSLLKGNVLIGHAGGAYGLVSGMYFDKYRRYGIIFFTNGGRYGADDGYSTYERELIAVIYNYLRPKINIENDIFTDLDYMKYLPKQVPYKMPEVKKRTGW